MNLLRTIFTLIFVGIIGALVTFFLMYPLEILATILFAVVLIGILSMIVWTFRFGYHLSGELVDKIERRWRG